MKIFFIENQYETDKTKPINEFFKDYVNPAPEDADVFISQGGDGTLIQDVHSYGKYKKPFYGINAGTVGFLMNGETGQPKLDKLLSIRNGELEHATVVDFETIRVEVDTEVGGEIVTETFNSLNEVMIGGDMNSFIHFNVEDKHNMIGKFSGGGIIISTVAGSTGINMNNHGGVLPLYETLWSITGDKVNRNIDNTISPKPMKITQHSRTPIKCWIDGSFKIIDDPKEVRISSGISVRLMYDDVDEFIRKRRQHRL